MGVQRKHVNELYDNRRTVTAATALILARVFGNSPDFWLNVQRRSDLWEAMNSPRERERITARRITHPERDDAPHVGPQPRRRRAVMRALLHPDHFAMTALGEPLPQALARSRRGIRACHADCGETEPQGLVAQALFE